MFLRTTEKWFSSGFHISYLLKIFGFSSSFLLMTLVLKIINSLIWPNIWWLHAKWYKGYEDNCFDQWTKFYWIKCRSWNSNIWLSNVSVVSCWSVHFLLLVHKIVFITKGQLTSKGLFGIFQKTNEKNRLNYYDTSGQRDISMLRSTCFRLFFGRIWRHQKYISKLTDL